MQTDFFYILNSSFFIHSPQSSPTSGARERVGGSTLVTSSSAAQSGQTRISPSTVSAARAITASHSGQVAFILIPPYRLQISDCRLQIDFYDLRLTLLSSRRKWQL